MLLNLEKTEIFLSLLSSLLHCKLKQHSEIYTAAQSVKERAFSQAELISSCRPLNFLTMLHSFAIKSIKVLQHLLYAEDFPCPSWLALYMLFYSGYHTALERGERGIKSCWCLDSKKDEKTTYTTKPQRLIVSYTE